jgi:predicted transcriptional regulator
MFERDGETAALRYTGAMEVHFTPEEEMRLDQIAAKAGIPVTSFVHETVSRTLEDEARFVAAVKKGIASADRGDLLYHESVVARIEKRFGP